MVSTTNLQKSHACSAIAFLRQRNSQRIMPRERVTLYKLTSRTSKFPFGFPQQSPPATCTQKPEVWSQFITNDNKSEAVQAKKKKNTQERVERKGKEREKFISTDLFYHRPPKLYVMHSLVEPREARFLKKQNNVVAINNFQFFTGYGQVFLLVLHLLSI